MCNIAGYTGFRRAAPILIEMMRREEGFWGGYYTGIATIHEGKLYSAKVLGDLDTLIRETDALELPGNVGIIHARTPSGGGMEWSYPFVSCDQKLGFVENGSLGHFKDATDFVSAAVELEEKGHHMTSSTTDYVDGYPRLPGGTSVHYSDVQCHLIEENMKSGLDPLDALMKTLRDYPCEDVGVAIHTEHPGKLFVSRYNQPMNLARAAGESFIATAPTAFPEGDYFGIQSLPANSGAVITPDCVLLKTVMNPAVKVADMNPGVVLKAYDLILQILREAKEPVPFSDFHFACETVFPEGELAQASPLGYAILDSMLRSGVVEVVTVTLPGMAEGLTAPAFRMQLK